MYNKLEELNKTLRRDLVSVCDKSNFKFLSDLIKNCSEDELMMILHFGFSENAFFETLSGQVKLTPTTLNINEEKAEEMFRKIIKNE